MQALTASMPPAAPTPAGPVPSSALGEADGDVLRTIAALQRLLQRTA
jgi:hypothetical protein